MRLALCKRLTPLWLLLALCGPLTAQQINLQTQVKGTLQPGNGGTGLTVDGNTGCLNFTSGTPSIGPCGGGGLSSVSIGTANGFQGTSSGGAAPILSIDVDASHVLPVNTGSASEYLDETGNYSIPTGTGAGTVTAVSCGTIPNLATCAVATATSTPAISYTAITQSANTFFMGPSSGSAAAPGFRQATAPDIAVAGTLTNSISGNANSATMLAGSPSQCGGTTPLATGIAASGNANCTAGSSIAAVTCTSSCAFNASGVVMGFAATLTASFTSSTFTNGRTGVLYTFTFTQDATGGRACTYPSGTKGANACSGTANANTQQTFKYDGTNLVANSAATIF